MDILSRNIRRRREAEKESRSTWMTRFDLHFLLPATKYSVISYGYWVEDYMIRKKL